MTRWRVLTALWSRFKRQPPAEIPDAEAEMSSPQSNRRAVKAAAFLAPSDLEVTDVGPHQVLIVGACFLWQWGEILKKLGYDDLSIDWVLFLNTTQLPASPPKPLETYDLQLIQIPLPSILPEHEHLRLPGDDPQHYQLLFDNCVRRLELLLKEALIWSDRVPAFVMTYLSPQQNLLGRLLPRYELRNPIHFIERLNMELAELLLPYRGARLLDTNHIASVYGRRFIQEDAYWLQFHGGLIMDGEEQLDVNRIEPPEIVAQVHGTAVDGFVELVWREVRAAYRTLKRADEIKMLCVDLDDTLWRGVIADRDQSLWTTTERSILDNRSILTNGWPLGIVEVLQYLKRRGVILVIVSKNDEAYVRTHWHKIFDEHQIRLDDFAIVKINWRPKSENIAEAIAEANVLPRNVLFLDDNPVERAGVRAAFPEIRTLETSHYRWGRVLAWSPELQVADISRESARRTDLIRAQVERQQLGAALSREDFLASLNLRIAVQPIRSASDALFARAFELVNKTNQFNTTGARWSNGEATLYFDQGGVWWTFELVDRFTNYGLVGVVCICGLLITQIAMSCRVAGLDAELAALSTILQRSGAPGTVFEGFLKETDTNAVTRDVFKRIGWSERDGQWRGPAPTTMPPHVSLEEPVSAMER